MSGHKDVLASTQTAHGGSGHPQPFVLGKGRRMLRGMELGVMGERGSSGHASGTVRLGDVVWQPI